MACGLRARGAVSARATLATDATPVREALDGAMTAIAAAGCETPRLDAELLLAHVLRVPRERLLTDATLAVGGEAVRPFVDAVRRRAGAREPVAYITGRRAFRRLSLGVDRRGNLIYAAAPDQTVRGLARILIHAGAVRAMELDINSYWVTLNSYRKTGGRGARKLLTGMTRPALRYLSPDDRDFFAVSTR